MKKYISLCMLAIVAMLASCSQNEELTANENDNLKTVTFSLRMDEMQTRATTTATVDRYVMEVYTADGAAANVFDGGTVNHKEQTTADFSIKLDATQSYTCLFWADNGAADIYDVSSLKAVTLKTGKQAIEQSYYGTVSVSGNTTSYSVTMTHAVGKISLMEHDHINAGSTLTMTYTPNASFNVADGTATAGSQTATEIPITTAIDNADKATASTYVDVFTCYMLAPSAQQLLNFKFSLTEGANTTTKSVSNVPVKCNVTTKIGGEFSNYTSKTLTATADDAWETTEKEGAYMTVGADYTHTALDGTQYACKVISSTSLSATVVYLTKQPSAGNPSPTRAEAQTELDKKGARFLTKAEFEKLVSDGTIPTSGGSTTQFSNFFCYEDCIARYMNSTFKYQATSVSPTTTASYFLVFDI